MSIQVDNKLHFGLSVFSAENVLDEPERQALKDYLLKLRQQQEQGVQRSNQKGWHSADDLHKSDEPLLKNLAEKIHQLGSKMIRHSNPQQQDKPIALTSLWANINDFGAWNAPHSHMPCEWSGCIYIDVNEQPEVNGGIGEGDILFFNPMPMGPQYNSPTTVNYSPKNGQLFLFPGHLVHMVAPHYEQQSRISMAFNFRLV